MSMNKELERETPVNPKTPVRTYRGFTAPWPLNAAWDSDEARWWRAGIDAAFASVYVAQLDTSR